MSSHAVSPSSRALPWRPWAVPRLGLATGMTLGVAALLAFVAFAANGGLRLGETTWVEITLILLTGAGGAAALLATPDRGRWNAAIAMALFGVLAIYTALSVIWSVQPSSSWIEASRTLTYAAVFAGSVALVRVAPRHWSSVVGGIALGGVVVCGYALATKVFPAALAADELYARLRAPYGYWNATGLTAAMAIPPTLWLGARRHGHAALNALAVPALGILVVTLMLSYSRGALLALGLGLAFWFAVVPLRLRGAAILATGATLAIPVALWAFGQEALTTDRLELGLRADAGTQLGLALLALVLALTAAGLAVGFALAAGRPDDRARHRVGLGLVVALALVPVGLTVFLATTDRGLVGSIDYGFTTLTDPKAATPPNDPSRLTAVGSVRSRYWNEALKAFQDHPVLGVGAEGYATVRPFYRQDTLEVRHAHGYGVQTLADLGLIGLGLSLALLAAWLAAAARAVGLRRGDRGRPFGPERIGLLTLASVVVVFGVHSFVDWTWFIPGTTVVALLAAGWVAGRGPLRDPAERARELEAPLRGPRTWRTAPRPLLIGALALVGGALVLSFAVWQPLRAQNTANAALTALERGDLEEARAKAISAADRNPLALDPLSVLAVVQSRAGRNDQALRTLQRQVRLQPANPETWTRLADFQFNRLKKPADALRSLRAALFLDPRNPDVIGAYLVARRRATGTKAPALRTPGAASTRPIRPGSAPVPSG